MLSALLSIYGFVSIRTSYWLLYVTSH